MYGETIQLRDTLISKCRDHRHPVSVLCGFCLFVGCCCYYCFVYVFLFLLLPAASLFVFVYYFNSDSVIHRLSPRSESWSILGYKLISKHNKHRAPVVKKLALSDIKDRKAVQSWPTCCQTFRTFLWQVWEKGLAGRTDGASAQLSKQQPATPIIDTDIMHFFFYATKQATAQFNFEDLSKLPSERRGRLRTGLLLLTTWKVPFPSEGPAKKLTHTRKVDTWGSRKEHQDKLSNICHICRASKAELGPLFFAHRKQTG